MRRCAPILGVTFALLACKPDPVLERVTGVRVTVETPKKDLDQYRYRIQDGAAMILSGALPDTPAPITDPSTSFVLVVDDALAGRELLLDVDAVRDAELVASGRVALTFVASTIVDVLVVLGEPAVCGDGVIQNNVEECDDGDRDNGDGCNLGCIVEPNFECRNEPSVCTSVDLECNGSCATGQRCLGGACICDAESCPTGCCAGEVCQSWDRGTCGPAGGQCSACDVLASDRCIGGQCQCGNGGPCGVGQLCSGGRCVCTRDSCAGGCCNGDSCEVRTLEMCGIDGATCTTCSSTTADNCAGTGACQCGVESACGAGQKCEDGQCVCNAKVCEDGCCMNNVCQRSMNVSQCGRGGATCRACGPGADACAPDGSCTCGSGPACATGQTCRNGSCTCDPAACAGCCDGNVCRTGDTDTMCGSGGGICVACGGTGPCVAGTCAGCAATCAGCCSGSTCESPTPNTCGVGGVACVPCDPARADTCSAGGSCTCGANPMCGDGQRCDSGVCVCDSNSCPNGCCHAGQCETRSPMACGVGGSTCTVCDTSTTDECDAAGQCVCGGQAPCPSGQSCIGGMCQCGGASCPNGCCANGQCIMSTFATCGSGGSICAACDAATADSCVGGECRCGAQPACGPGLHCANGSCICDETSCGGCCAQAVCFAGTSSARCGLSGGICEMCAPGDVCRADGSCGPSCDSGNCPNGCCRNGACQAGTANSRCGTSGADCANCNPLGQSCVAQMCQ